MMRPALLLCALAATAHADPSWTDGLVKELGAPVAIVAGDNGIHAVSADGARKKDLLPGATPWVLVDFRGDVIWYPRGGKKSTDLMMIDLRAPTLAPESMVTGMAPELSAGVVYTDGWRFAFGGVQRQKAVITIGEKKTKLDFEEGILGNFGDGAVKKFERGVKKGKITPAQQKRFAEIYARGAGKKNPYVVPAAAKNLPRNEEGMKHGHCDDTDMCGAVEPLPGTKLQLVTVGYSCGDGCYVQKQIYDPATREFVDPVQKQRSKTIIATDTGFGDVWIAPAGDAFVGGGRVGRFGGGVVQIEELGEGGGWLGGGYYVEF